MQGPTTARALPTELKSCCLLHPSAPPPPQYKALCNRCTTWCPVIRRLLSACQTCRRAAAGPIGCFVTCGPPMPRLQEHHAVPDDQAAAFYLSDLAQHNEAAHSQLDEVQAWGEWPCNRSHRNLCAACTGGWGAAAASRADALGVGAGRGLAPGGGALHNRISARHALVAEKLRWRPKHMHQKRRPFMRSRAVELHPRLPGLLATTSGPLAHAATHPYITLLHSL